MTTTKQGSTLLQMNENGNPNPAVRHHAVKDGLNMLAKSMFLLSISNVCIAVALGVEQGNLMEVYRAYTSNSIGNETPEQQFEWAATLESALQSHPNDPLRPRILDEVGALYNASEHVSDAKRVYEILRKESIDKGDYSSQIIALENLVAISIVSEGYNADTLEAYHVLEVALSAPPPQQADYYGRKLVDAYGAHATAALAATNISQTDQYIGESVEYFNKYLDNRSPQSIYPLPTMQYQAAQALAKNGNDIEAADMLERLLSSEQTEFPEARLFNEANSIRYGNRTEEYQLALQEYISEQGLSLEEDEYFPRLLMDLSESYMNTGQVSKAIPLLEKLLSMDSNLLAPLPQRMIQLASALAQSGQISRAKELIVQLISDYPNDVNTSSAKALLERLNSLVETSDASKEEPEQQKTTIATSQKAENDLELSGTMTAKGQDINTDRNLEAQSRRPVQQSWQITKIVYLCAIFGAAGAIFTIGRRMYRKGKIKEVEFR